PRPGCRCRPPCRSAASTNSRRRGARATRRARSLCSRTAAPRRSAWTTTSSRTPAEVTRAQGLRATLTARHSLPAAIRGTGRASRSAFAAEQAREEAQQGVAKAIDTKVGIALQLAREAFFVRVQQRSLELEFGHRCVGIERHFSIRLSFPKS